MVFLGYCYFFGEIGRKRVGNLRIIGNMYRQMSAKQRQFNKTHIVYRKKRQNTPFPEKMSITKEKEIHYKEQEKGYQSKGILIKARSLSKREGKNFVLTVGEITPIVMRLDHKIYEKDREEGDC